MVIVQLTTDNREPFREYHRPRPWFGAAPEALLQGFAAAPEVEVHVVTCTQRPMVASPEKLAENIWFHSLPVRKIGWMRTAYQGCIRAVRGKLRAIKPDLVHGQGTERDCALSAVLSGFPNVITIHGNMAEQARLFRARVGSYAWLAARLEVFALRRTLGALCHSAYTEGLVRPRARKTWRVPNALRRAFFEPARAAAPREGKCVMLNVGVVSPRKRQLELLQTARDLQQRGLNFELRFIGVANPADPYAAAFLKQIQPLAAQGCASYLGEKPVEELIRCFDAADGLVHFPSEEAFGLVVAEALARGLKFFGSRLGGIVDITEGVPGAELYGAEDWAGLGTAMARWLAQGHPRTQGAAAFMRERYHPDLIVRQHIAIYRELLSTRR